MLASITPLGERGRAIDLGRDGERVPARRDGGAAPPPGALLGRRRRARCSERARRDARLAVLAVGPLVARRARRSCRAVCPARAGRSTSAGSMSSEAGSTGSGSAPSSGSGSRTIVSSAATYVALLAAFLAGDARRGALVLGCFGAVRGLQPLAAARVRRPDQLRRPACAAGALAGRRAGRAAVARCSRDARRRRSSGAWRDPGRSRSPRSSCPRGWSGRLFSRAGGVATLHAGNFTIALRRRRVRGPQHRGDATRRLVPRADRVPARRRAEARPGPVRAAPDPAAARSRPAFAGTGLAHPRPGQVGMQHFFTAVGATVLPLRRARRRPRERVAASSPRSTTCSHRCRSCSRR